MANRRREQARLARLEIVSEMYLRQHTVRQIRSEVMKRLNLATYSIATVHKDIRAVLKELQETRLDNMEYALQVELERIDDACRELWGQYRRSKEDRRERTVERKGVPTFGGDSSVKTSEIKQKERDMPGLGDPRYIAEIREQLKERRKLLGLYCAEKREIRAIVDPASREELKAELRRLESLTD